MTLDFALKTMEASAMVAQNQAAAPPQPGAGPALTAATPLPEAPPPDFGDDDEIVRQLYAQAAAAKQNFDNAMRAAKKGTRDVAAARYKQDLDHAHRALVERKTFLWRRYQEQALRPPAAPGMEGIGAQNTAENTVAGARVKLQALRLYDETLMKDIQQLQEKISILNVSALDIKADEDELRIAEETARSVQNEIQRLEVELTAPPRISVIDPAKTPKTRDETKKIKMTGMAGLGAFGLVVMGITFLEYRARRISSADEVVQNLGLRLVGALPTVPAGGGQRGLKRLGRQVDEHWRSRLVESVDATRTMLLHASRTESIRVVMISSALKGEGKTSLSGHLATSLARAGRKTLLIDCDLRKPDVHKLFDVPPEPGLCEILRGETDPMAVIQPTAAGELYVLTAGRCDPLALQALAQDGARAVFDALLSQFDFLIVDSAPILPVADSLLLAQQVDAVLFSILRDVSCVPHVQSAYERIAGLGARVLGAVVNGTASPSYGYKGYSVYTR